MKAPSFRLDGRHALVVGGSRGLGLASAHALAQAGARVCVAARENGALASACAGIAADGGDAYPWPVDVTDTAQVDELFARSAPFRVVVNCAGSNRPAPLVDSAEEDIDFVLGLNLKASLIVMRAAARALLAAGLGGSFITMSSQMGSVGSPRRSVYCATKHGVEGMTKSLAWELGAAGIRVNTICPTFVETDMTRAMLADPAFKADVLSRIALRRLASLEDVMGAVTFLASDASAMVTGSALMVDGGWTAI